MPFITQGKINLKYILIVVVLAIIVGGGILGYQYLGTTQKKVDPSTEMVELSTEEEVDLSVVDEFLKVIFQKPFPAKEVFADQVIAQIKIISKKSEVGAWPAKYEIKVERIGSYYLYPDARHPQLKVGDRMVAYFTIFYDYNSQSVSLDNIVVGTSYPAYLTICHIRQVVCPKDEEFQSWMVNLFPVERIVPVVGLKITSPVSGNTVRIGETIVFRVEVDDPLNRNVFYSTSWGEYGYIEAPSYETNFTIPSKFDFGGRSIGMSPGQKRIGVVGGDKVSSDEVFINVVK